MTKSVNVQAKKPTTDVESKMIGWKIIYDACIVNGEINHHALAFSLTCDVELCSHVHGSHMQ